jgi:hypothetical protein
MHLTPSLISSASFLSPRIQTGRNRRLPWSVVAGAGGKEAKARQGGVQMCDSQARNSPTGVARREGVARRRKATRRRVATGEEGRRSTRARPQPCVWRLDGAMRPREGHHRLQLSLDRRQAGGCGI